MYVADILRRSHDSFFTRTDPPL